MAGLCEFCEGTWFLCWFCPSLWFPSYKLMEHVCHTRCTVEVTNYISCRSSLDFLQQVFVLLGPWIPGSGSILEMRLHQGVVQLLLVFLGAAGEVSHQEIKCVGGFCSSMSCLGVPFKVVLYTCFNWHGLSFVQIWQSYHSASQSKNAVSTLPAHDKRKLLILLEYCPILPLVMDGQCRYCIFTLGAELEINDNQQEKFNSLLIYQNCYASNTFLIWNFKDLNTKVFGDKAVNNTIIYFLHLFSLSHNNHTGWAQWLILSAFVWELHAYYSWILYITMNILTWVVSVSGGRNKLLDEKWTSQKSFQTFLRGLDR